MLEVQSIGQNNQGEGIKPVVTPPNHEVSGEIRYVHINNPRTLLEENLAHQYGLPELIVFGHGVGSMEPGDVQEQLAIEYADATDVILALGTNGKAIGSFSIRRLIAEDHPKTADFVNQVKATFPEKSNRPILHYNGIVVDRAYRNKGVGTRMVQEAINLMSPSVIIGETKAPEAVAVRMKLGHSYYGFRAIGQAPPVDEKLRNVIDSYVEANNQILGDLWLGRDVDYGKNGVFLVSDNYLPNYVPIPNDSLSQVFQDVCTVQMRENAEGTGRTAVAPIITIIE